MGHPAPEDRSMLGLPQYRNGPVRARASRVLLIYLVALLLTLWMGYTVLIRYGLNSAAMTEQDTSPTSTEDQYGVNARPAFADLIQIRDLPSAYLPETGKHRHSGRLVIVGDVHGMKRELLALLEKVKFNTQHDHLILAGDMISKGPDSPGVIDLAMELGASAVRGNHEDRIILAHKDMVSKHAVKAGPNEDIDEAQDNLEEESFSHGDYKDRSLVKALGNKRIKWLEKCPVILRVGTLGDMGEVVVVHAGLVPGIPLEKQDPSMVMNMRTIKDGMPSDEREGQGWMKVWNKYQKSLPRKKRSTVIYGHDSKRGLQTADYSMGIDTGCLKGGQLTAVVIEGGSSNHKHKIVHVNCKDGRQDR